MMIKIKQVKVGGEDDSELHSRKALAVQLVVLNTKSILQVR